MVKHLYHRGHPQPRRIPLIPLLALLALASLAPACKDAPTPPDSATPALADAGPDLSGEVGASLVFDGQASAGVTFVWDFGDGEQAEGQRAEHAYAAPGNYTAVLSVTGSDGSRRSDSARVTVYLPIAATPGVWSSTLALAGDRLWFVSPEANRVSSISTADGALREGPDCADPRTLSVVDDAVAVSCAGEDSLLLIDVRSGAERRRVALPAHSQPHGVVGRDGVIWVSLQATGQVARVEDGVVSLRDVGPDPRALALDSAGTLWISRWRSPDEGATLYRLDQDPVRLTIDPGPDSDTTNGGVPNLIETLLPSPDGGRVYVPAVQHNLLRGLVLNGLDPTQETTMRAVLVTVSEGTEDLHTRKQFDQRGRAIAAVSSPEGNTLFVLHPDVGAVSVIDAYSGDIVGSIAAVGHAPTGLVMSPDGATLYVYAWLDRKVRAYDVRDLSVPPPVLGEWDTVSVEPLEAEDLLGKQLFWLSSDTRITRDGYIACANCHPDGRDDGRVWDFTDRGEGLRNTTSLLGRGGTAMGPVHWTGNFDEIQDFENDIRNHFGGTGLLSDADWAECSDPLGSPKAGRSADLDALAVYVSGLDSPTPSPFPESPEGAELFQLAGCASCHTPPLYTDSALETMLRHDVGTITARSGQRLGGPLDGFDTPTLLGAFDTPPYLHDGSAASIEDAISAHDSAEALTPEQLGALADFVRSL